MSGDWMREDGPKSDIESHNVFTTFVDGTFQIFCKNRPQAGFVLSNVPTGHVAVTTFRERQTVGGSRYDCREPPESKLKLPLDIGQVR
jgi:hypothetical protein